MQKLLSVSFLSALSLTIANPALAIQFQFVKLVDTQTVMPSEGRPFTGFDSASISGSSVVFRGTIGQPTERRYREGIYLLRDRALSKVVDLRTRTPRFRFAQFASPMLSGNNVAFIGINSTRSMSLYTQVEGKPLTSIVNATTAPANNNPFFWRFGTSVRSRMTPSMIHMDGPNIVFDGGYGYFGGQVQRVTYDGISPRINGTRIVTFIPPTAFNGTGQPTTDRGRIQLTVGSSAPATIVDNTTLLPHGKLVSDFGGGLSSGFGSGVRRQPNIPTPIVNANTVFFFANDSDGEGGLYTRRDTGLRTIIRQGTVVPDIGPVQSFGGIGISGINQAFSIREGRTQTALVMRTGGQILKVFKLGDSIDGKQIAAFNPLGTQFLSGRSIVFIVRFTDGSSGIYRAQATPENAAEAIAMARDREPD